MVLQVALVGQEPVLYARSVKENVAYGLDCWDLALVERATKLANAHEFITSMTDKYDTNTGEKGLQLSGMRTCNRLCSKHVKYPVFCWRLQHLAPISRPPAIDGSTARRCIAIVTNERRASYVIPLNSS